MTSGLRTLGFGLIVCALVLAAAGSVGFSTASVDRDVNVAVTDDANALVGYDSPERIVVENRGKHSNGTASAPADKHSNGTDSVPANVNSEHTLVEVTNRLHTPIDVVDVEVDAPDVLDIELQQSPQHVGVGESGDVRAEISCEEPIGTTDVSVTIRIEGEHVAASIFGDTETRTISVTCA